MTDIKILGIGSPFADDQLGWQVIERLTQRQQLTDFIPQHVQLLACDRPGTRILELMRGANHVYLIDAVITGAKAGTIHRLQAGDICTLPTIFSTHAIGLAEAIQIGYALQELPGNLVLYGIEITEVNVQFQLTKPIMKAVEQVVFNLESEVKSLLQPG